jgi:serine/threonine-protein kinase RsbT
VTQVSVVAVEVLGEGDIVSARVKAKAIAEAMGFNYIDQTRIATAVSELARNAFQYAGRGRVTITPVEREGGRGMEIVVEDHGSGIKDVELALKGGYSTSRGLGMGLSGSKKLMDEFDIKTRVGEGTVITIRKWL